VFSGGQINLQQLMQQAQQMQAELVAAQASLASELAAREVEGHAGGGLVTAVVNGSGDLLRLAIEPSAIDPDDAETLADLVVAAVRDAQRAAAEAAETAGEVAMGPIGEGLGNLGLPPGLGIPGFPA
jgi:hypothetical protein